MATTLSEEDFNRLQSQLIDLRTKNYELGVKLHKAEVDNSSLLEKCSSHEREIQKMSKLMKFPGFQAITKSKKKGMAELAEENERLTQQMQRHEEDFKLQNQTLLEEVSRLSAENAELKSSFQASAPSATGDILKLKAENQALQNAVHALQSQMTVRSPDVCNSDHLRGNAIDAAGAVRKIDEYRNSLSAKLDRLSTLIGAPASTNSSGNDVSAHDALGSSNQPESGSEDSNLHNSNSVGVGAVVQCSPLIECVLEFKGELEKVMGALSEVFLSIDSARKVECSSIAGSNLQLEAAASETMLLQKQLREHMDASEKEISFLKSEVEKWSEKAKKKQESYRKLNDEKEKNFEDSRVAYEKLKTEKSTEIENLKSKIARLEDQLQKALQLNQLQDLQGKLDALRQENAAMQEELISLREKHKVDQTKKLQELDSKLQEKTNELLNLKSQLQAQHLGLEEAARKLEEASAVNLKLGDEVRQANELAVRRKVLMDELAVQRQTDVESSNKKLEELRCKYESDVQEVTTKHKEEVDDLKSQLVSSKKMKKDLDEALASISLLQGQLQSQEKTSGWLKRTLQETEESLEAAKVLHSQAIADNEIALERARGEFELQLAALQGKHELEMQDKQRCCDALQQQASEQSLLVDKLKQAAKDREVEFHINTKKNDLLLKDLKRQLKLERKRGDQVQSKLQDFLQEVKVKQTYEELFNPDALQMKGHRRQDSGSHMSNISSASNHDHEDASPTKGTISPVASSTSISLSEETVDLISRIADLQQEKWVLEERVRHLEENGAVMVEDLMQKSQIIQTYIMENKADTTPASHMRNRTLTLKEKVSDKLKLSKSEETVREMNKMQRMLEETLTKNIQLQKDVDLLTRELETVRRTMTDSAQKS